MNLGFASTWVSGQPRSTATSIHPFVQYAKVTLLEISPCQCPIVKRSGVAYSCSYVLLMVVMQSLSALGRAMDFLMHHACRQNDCFKFYCLMIIQLDRTVAGWKQVFTASLDPRHSQRSVKAPCHAKGPLWGYFSHLWSSSLTFFCLKALGKNMKKWHTFCAHAQWQSPWRRKNVEKGHLAPSNLTFLLIAMDTNGFRRMKEEGQIYKRLPQFS